MSKNYLDKYYSEISAEFQASICKHLLGASTLFEDLEALQRSEKM